jgi:hypothetical protein
MIQLQKLRGAGVKSWDDIYVKAVNYNDTATFKMYYNSLPNFDAVGTTPALALGNKIFSKLGETLWSTSYNQANSSPLPVNLQALRLTAATQTLNKVVDIDQSTIDTFKFIQEASVNTAVTNIRLYTGSGLTNYYNVALPVSTVNKPTKYEFKLVAGAYGTAITSNSNYDLGVATVTAVGSPAGNIKRIDTIAQTLTASNTITPIALFGLNNLFEATGSVVEDIICCFDGVELTTEDETEDVFCKGQKTETIIKSRTVSGTITIQKVSPISYALGLGNALRSVNISVPVDLAGYGATQTTNRFTTTSGVTSITLPVNTVVDSVIIDGCLTLSRTEINTGSANLDVNCYHYNSATGVLTVNSEHDAKAPNIKTLETKFVSSVSMYPKYNATKVYLRLARTSTNGAKTYVELASVQMTPPVLSVADDGDTYDVEFSATLTKESDAFYAFA